MHIPEFRTSRVNVTSGGRNNVHIHSTAPADAAGHSTHISSRINGSANGATTFVEVNGDDINVHREPSGHGAERASDMDNNVEAAVPDRAPREQKRPHNKNGEEFEEDEWEDVEADSESNAVHESSGVPESGGGHESSSGHESNTGHRERTDKHQENQRRAPQPNSNSSSSTYVDCNPHLNVPLPNHGYFSTNPTGQWHGGVNFNHPMFGYHGVYMGTGMGDFFGAGPGPYSPPFLHHAPYMSSVVQNMNSGNVSTVTMLNSGNDNSMVMHTSGGSSRTKNKTKNNARK